MELCRPRQDSQLLMRRADAAELRPRIPGEWVYDPVCMIYLN
ncbi:hypothetical protein [Larkinella soli]|nr:hypothetical protein [Larkinella soli]